MYYLCDKNKGADQLHGHCAAYLRLCFCLCKSRFSHKAHLVMIDGYLSFSHKNVNCGHPWGSPYGGTSNEYLVLPTTNEILSLGFFDQVQHKPGCKATEDGFIVK